jgi:hypothetical protein
MRQSIILKISHQILKQLKQNRQMVLHQTRKLLYSKETIRRMKSYAKIQEKMFIEKRGGYSQYRRKLNNSMEKLNNQILKYKTLNIYFSKEG